jgi:acyl-CoA synthetase (AMP-forming)/AMP-acid ligase II
MLADGAVQDSYTYGSFAGRANYVAHRLVELGLEPGTVVLLAYPPGIEIAVALFACVRAGLIAVPVPAPSGSGRNASWNRLAHIATHSGATHILTTSALARSSGRSHGDPDETAGTLPRIATDELVGRSPAFAARPSEVLFLQYTSGSTRAPRGVVVSHANVIHNADLSVDHQHPVGVSWLPHFHDMGLLGYFIFSLVKAARRISSPRAISATPAFWLQLISRTRADDQRPNLAFDYCLRDGKVTDDLEVST